jgi:hypothetical protein
MIPTDLNEIGGLAANTYCMERVPGGFNLMGRLCQNRIPITETICGECKRRATKKAANGNGKEERAEADGVKETGRV